MNRFTHLDYHNKGFDDMPLFDTKKDFSKSDFDGVTYESAFDASRLRGEMKRVYDVMTGRYWQLWLTLREISQITGDPEASISARLRDLRKTKFGAHTVNRRRRGDPSKGVFEYQLL